MLNYVKQRVRERGDLHGEVTIRGGDQVGHDGDDDMCWPVRSCLTLREAPKASNAREHHLANMWMWFNAGLLPLAAFLTRCLCFSACFVRSTACMFFLYALFFIRVGVERIWRQ